MANLETIVQKRLENLKSKHSIPKPVDNGGTFNAETASQQTVIIDEAGLHNYFQLVSFLCEQKHPTTGQKLGELHGEKVIDTMLGKFLRLKKPNYKQFVDFLINKEFVSWDIFVRITGITYNQTIETDLGTLHPPGLPKAKRLFTPKFFSDYPDDLNSYFIQIKDVKAMYPETAFLEAREQAKLVVSLVPNAHAGLSVSKSIEIQPFFLYVNNKLPLHERAGFSSTVPHRGLTFNKKSKHDEYAKKRFLSQISDLKAVKLSCPDLYERLRRCCISFQNAKIVTDHAVKILLLVASLDALLMEKYYPNQDNVFTKRLKAFATIYFLRLPSARPASLSFLDIIYKMRNKVAHEAKRHELTPEQYHILEVFIHSLVITFSKSKATTHEDALKQVGLFLT